jgi:hypothetical protein
MYIATKYRRMGHVGGVRKRLAKMIVAALAKEGIEARCEPKDLWPAQGYWRQIEQDVMSWEGYCEVKSFDKWMKRSLGSWDRMSSCVKGLTIDGDGFGYEVCATNELEPSKRFGLINKVAAHTRS